MTTKHNNEAALLIFIKNAEKGKVKTRLASTVGAEKALQIYQALLQHTRTIAQSVKANRLLFYSSFVDLTDEWPAADFQKYVQQGQDLGARIQHAFALAFENYEKVVIIGSDCASLSTAIVDAAFAKLEEHPFVIGPAMDGGYYLLGMRSYHPEVFTDIPWSTEQVFATTVQRIEALGASYAQLPTLSDIDFEEDWATYGWELPQL